MMKFLKIIIGFVLIGAFAYVYRSPFQTLFTRLGGLYLPCEKPITYKIESFDARFGISREYFLSALRDAEAIWEKPIDRDLFAFQPLGNLKINLIYDYRQQATTKLQKLGLAVSDDKASFNTLRIKYDALKVVYTENKVSLELKILDYEARQSAYEKEVANWNSSHRKLKDVYDQLNVDRIALNALGQELNRLEINLKEEVDNINALVVVLNRLEVSLNLDVSKFNTVGETLGSEFEEGSYQSGPGGQQIDIYEFENRAKLVKVLAHELGHALGLLHLDSPTAIMYRLNSGINGKLTTSDLAALKKLCGLVASQVK